MLRFVYGAFLTAKLLIGTICMRWSLLLAIHQMVRLVMSRLTTLSDSLSSQLGRGVTSNVLFCGSFTCGLLYIFLKCLKGALVGSYKGSCRVYNTSGMNSLSLSECVHARTPRTVLSLLHELSVPFL